MKLSHLAENLIGSEIIKIGNEVNERIAQGEKIANLTIGDLNSTIYPIPALLKQGVIEAYDKNLTNYPPANGLANLRKAISEDISSRWNASYSINEILVAGGSRPLIYAAYKSIVDAGEKVIYPVPSWNNNHYTFLSEGEGIEIHTKAENNFLPIAEEIIPHLGDAVLLALCSPQNPTGTMYSREKLLEICLAVVEENKMRGANQKPLYLLYDQIYAMLTFGENKHYHPVELLEELRPYTIYIDGISKCFAATGVRVGWSFGPLEVIEKMKSFLGHLGAWAPKPEQEATANFLTDKDEVNSFVTHFKEKLHESLLLLHKGIQSLKNEGLPVDSIEPMGAMYLTLKLDFIGKTTKDGIHFNDSARLVFYLIENAGLAIVPFSAFGNAGSMPWFRASAGGLGPEEILSGIERLRICLLDFK